MSTACKITCIIFLLACVGTISGQRVGDSFESVSASANITVGQYYVSPTGSDSNNGSAAHPWKTITHAATMIGAGATVHVAPGTYTGYITTYAKATSSLRITYISDGQWAAKIVGNRADHSTWHNYGNYGDIMGFEVTSVGRIGLYHDGSHVRYIANHGHDIAGPTSPARALGGPLFRPGNFSSSD